MQLSKFSDYAFRALIYLANQNGTMEQLATELNTSLHHMKKVVSKLAKHGYIQSSKGRSGGLALKKAPNEINLADVLLLCEENMDLYECFHENQCPLLKSGCKLKGVACRALVAFIETYRQYTLEDILSN